MNRPRNELRHRCFRVKSPRHRSRWNTYEPPRIAALRTPVESDHRLSESGDPGGKVRWRPWPCSQCAAGATPISFLRASHGTNPQVPNHSSALQANDQIGQISRFERDKLVSWCAICAHEGVLRQDAFLRVAEGSEHTVYKVSGDDRGPTEVFKVTHLCVYGDYYEMERGRISQFACTP